MNRPTRRTLEWQIGPVSGQSLSRDQNGQLTLPLQVVHLGKHVANSPLLLTVAEAEQLHASLCYALDGEPMRENAPDCRKPIQLLEGEGGA
ncbi:hypothetical protein [Streptomyces sp. NPDC056641]|uniref:hypothetical protein n=1 Tax=unclassified Streptomyces TaxID=2593676 RepID=UPI0036A2AFD1